jgi:thiamine-phosphate pyrophosphorylase
MSLPEARGLYVLIDPEHTRGRAPEAIARAALAGGCAVLQLRAKRLPDAARLALAERLCALAHAAGVPFVMNDRADLALLSSADGLHLGQDDLPLPAVRRLAPKLTLSLSTHSLAQALEGARAGAELLGFGPIFPTRSKTLPEAVVGLAALAEVVRAVRVPVIAIGGITLETAREVAATGAQLGAVISAVGEADDPEQAARALHAALGGRPA